MKKIFKYFLLIIIIVVFINLVMVYVPIDDYVKIPFSFSSTSLVVFLILIFGVVSIANKRKANSKKNTHIDAAIDEQKLAFLDSKRNDSDVYEALYILYANYSEEFTSLIKKYDYLKDWEFSIFQEQYVCLKITSKNDLSYYASLDSDKAIILFPKKEAKSVAGYHSDEIINLLINNIKLCNKEN